MCALLQPSDFYCSAFNQFTIVKQPNHSNNFPTYPLKNIPNQQFIMKEFLNHFLGGWKDVPGVYSKGIYTLTPWRNVIHTDTVDGSEIQLSPVEVDSLSHDLRQVENHHPKVGGWPWDFWLPSTVLTTICIHTFIGQRRSHQRLKHRPCWKTFSRDLGPVQPKKGFHKFRGLWKPCVFFLRYPLPPIGFVEENHGWEMMVDRPFFNIGKTCWFKRWIEFLFKTWRFWVTRNDELWHPCCTCQWWCKLSSP